MAETPDCAQSLAFFGRVTASVSHEMKNYLALINEYNGLLCDLVMAHEMGRELDLGRLKSLSGDIKRQVTAGGVVLDHLSSFAHSVDQFSQDQNVDLERCLALFVGLSRRNAGRRGVELELSPLPETVSLRTQPFLLLQGLWQVLEAALGGCPAGGRLNLSTCVEQGQVLLELRGASPAGEQEALCGPAEGILAALGASFSRREDGCLRLSLPR